jgi:hypothetical protein
MNPNKPKMRKSRRVSAIPRTGLGTARYRLLKVAASRLARAHADGYCIEALMLTESMLSDRVESRITHLTGRPIDAAAGLSKMLTLLEKHECVDQFRALIRPIRVWSRARNVAAHGMAKLHDINGPSWDARLSAAAAATMVGVQLLVDFAAVDAAERQRAGVRRPASAPDAFAEIERLLRA